MKKEGGIYIITNTINKKVYVGSAVCFEKRFRLHKSDLLKGIHNKRIQNFVDKYGFNSLKFEIIEVINDKEKLIEREQYWIDYYQSYKSTNGFNICKLAGSTLGVKMPKSHKEACRTRMIGNKYCIGKKWSEQEKKEIGKRSSNFWRDNPNTKKRMAEKMSRKRKGIQQWVNTPHPLLGKEHPAKGQKRSKEFCELMRKQRLENNGMKGVKLSEERKKKISRFHSKPVLLISDNGDIIKEYESAISATLDLKLTKGAVCRVCKGEYKHTKGYKFRYK